MARTIKISGVRGVRSQPRGWKPLIQGFLGLSRASSPNTVTITSSSTRCYSCQLHFCSEILPTTTGSTTTKKKKSSSKFNGEKKTILEDVYRKTLNEWSKYLTHYADVLFELNTMGKMMEIATWNRRTTRNKKTKQKYLQVRKTGRLKSTTFS